MDIRIGNDVQIDVRINNLNTYPDKAIKSIWCILYKIDDCENNSECKSCSQFCCPSKYTMNCCGAYRYYVAPHNNKVLCNCTTPFVFRTDCCCMNEKYLPIPYKKQPSSDLLSCYFISALQHDCGKYGLKIQLSACEKDYGFLNKHTYSFDYGHVLTISSEEDSQSGVIKIDCNKEFEIQTYKNTTNN